MDEGEKTELSSKEAELMGLTNNIRHAELVDYFKEIYDHEIHVSPKRTPRLNISIRF
jgi:hypothetical protein